MFISKDAYTTEDIIYHWRNDTKEVEMNSKINLPEYSIMNVTHEVCNTHFGSTGDNHGFQSINQSNFLYFITYILTTDNEKTKVEMEIYTFDII